MKKETLNNLFEYTASSLSTYAVSFEDLVASANDFGIDAGSDIGVALRAKPGAEIISLDDNAAEKFIEDSAKAVVDDNLISSQELSSELEPPAYLSEAPPPNSSEYDDTDSIPVDEFANFESGLSSAQVGVNEKDLSAETQEMAPIQGELDQSEIRLIMQTLREHGNNPVTLGMMTDYIKTIGKSVSEDHPFKAIHRDDLRRLAGDEDAQIDVNRYINYRNVYLTDIAPTNEHRNLERHTGASDGLSDGDKIPNTEAKELHNVSAPAADNQEQTRSATGGGGDPYDGGIIDGLGNMLSVTAKATAKLIGEATRLGGEAKSSIAASINEYKANRAVDLASNQKTAMEAMKDLGRQSSRLENLTERISTAEDGPHKKGLVTKAVKQVAEINGNLSALCDKRVAKSLSSEQRTKLHEGCENLSKISKRIESDKSPLSDRLKDANKALKETVANLMDVIRDFVAKLANSFGMSGR